MLYGVGRAACAVGEAAQIDGRIVGEGIGLQVRPEVFDGVEFRGVGRQVFKMRRAGKDALVHELTLVGLEAVPDEHDRRAELALQMLEEVHGALGIDVGIGMKPEVQREPIACGCDAKGGDRRHLLVAAPALVQQWSVPAQAPGAAHQRGHEHAGFVEENDRRSQARGVFFTRGQSCSIQARMRCSSRSRARRVGFWGEKPKPCRSRLTWAG
jgi:hypothetical protein